MLFVIFTFFCVEKVEETKNPAIFICYLFLHKHLQYYGFLFVSASFGQHHLVLHCYSCCCCCCCCFFVVVVFVMIHISLLISIPSFSIHFLPLPSIFFLLFSYFSHPLSIPLYYTWKKDNGPLPERAVLTDRNRVLQIRDAQPEDAGSYTCRVAKDDRIYNEKTLHVAIKGDSYVALSQFFTCVLSSWTLEKTQWLTSGPRGV